MKLDMYEINKLNPPGLLELAGVLALINRLIGLVAKCGEANAASLRYARMIAQNTKHLRERQDFNTNLRIKVWVLQTAERRAWVRTVIGESRIALWQHDYDALARHEAPPSRERAAKPPAHSRASTSPTKPRKDYERKPFALPKLADIFIMPFDFSKETAFPAFAFNGAYTSRPRKTPGRKPVIFWPSELATEDTPDPEPTLVLSSNSSTLTEKEDTDPDTVSKPEPPKSKGQLNYKPP